MFSYKDTLSLIESIDNKFQLVLGKTLEEKNKKEELEATIVRTKDYIAAIRTALLTLSTKTPTNESKEETMMNIGNWWSKITLASAEPTYIVEASHLMMLYCSTANNIERLKNEQYISELRMNQVKNHKNYRTWVKNSDKLKMKIIPDVMPDSLVEYSERAIDMIISYGAKVLWEPYKRYMFYHLYTVYKKEIKLDAERTDYIGKFTYINDKAGQLIPKWNGLLEDELKRQIELLEEYEQTLATFDNDSDKRICEYISGIEKELLTEFPNDDINGWLSDANSYTSVWNDVQGEEDINKDEKEDFVISNYIGKSKTTTNINPYTFIFAKKVVADYCKLLYIENNAIHFNYPLQMHLDTLKYRLSFTVNEETDTNISRVNGQAQRIVSSIIANMPVGKAKFVYVDPRNTGVFSLFRDVGKNDVEGSRPSTYAVDSEGIRRELERVSNEIAYTINNILKGTKTTLYQHNKERAFNSSPYEFLFLMDFPQNMTTQSLLALKNIVENGPKCGVFTFIFSNAPALNYLRPEDKNIAFGILSNDFVINDGLFINQDGCWLKEESELSISDFDKYVESYNEATKGSQQLTVYLDELSGKVCEKGEYKIPIGKNLGGEVEYMSFFGSCQDYLMSGATRIGKTNALHVIIYNTLKYVPDAELYLVDFKQGVEFATYAGLNHPSIKALAVESVPEFGHAVLCHIEDRIKTISEQFINAQVTNWKEYYEKTGEVIPVTLVILDEFQHLFDTDVGKDCSRIIELIAKEGGAFNVHIILATQSMSSVSGLSTTAQINIFGRMSFYHSEAEYAAMLWGVTNLAMSLRGDVKGQMVFATGDANTQRLLQWALAKPASKVVEELGLPVEECRYPTKLLLSTIRENPFSMFNAIINKRFKVDEADDCEIVIGNEIDVFSDNSNNPIVSGKQYDVSCMKIGHRTNENVLMVGGNENVAESSFQLAIYSALARQVALNKKNSIVLLAPESVNSLRNIYSAFNDYIEFFDQESDLSQINLTGKEYMFVFGLQNFRSMSYQPDSQMIAARNDAFRPTVNNVAPFQRQMNPAVSDGQILQAAIDSESINVFLWHNNVQNLASMFGGPVKVQDFLYKFVHKVVFRLNDKNDSRLVINSDAGAELSAQAAIYMKRNNERVIRPYKAMDESYCNQLNKALRELEEGFAK